MSNIAGYLEKQRELYKYRKMRKKKKLKLYISVLFVFLFSIGTVGTLFFAPFFNIAEVYCVGNNKLKSDEIIGVSGVLLGDNIFRTSIDRLKTRVAKIPYVKESNVRREFPNKIKIWVRECTPMAVVTKDDIYLALDETGKVLESLTQTGEYKIPVIRGLDITGYNAGEKIAAENKKNMSVGLECLNEVIKNDLLYKVISIDVSYINRISINYENRLNVTIDSAEQIGYNIKRLKNIAENHLALNEQGVLDLTGEQAHFTRTD